MQVDEASEAYQRAMRNIPAAGPGICRVCWTFIDPDWDTCFRCGHQPQCLDVVIPITLSENLGQMHLALRAYKDDRDPDHRRYAAVRLAGILWRFLREHESCVAAAAGVEEFDVVTVVPSSDPRRDKRAAFQKLAGVIKPIKKRLTRTLEPTGEVEGREFDPRRYRPTENLAGNNVLLLDDTWTTGGHAQSAGQSLLEAGATGVALVVIGRHIDPGWKPVGGSEESCKDLLKELPSDFDWELCAAETVGSM